jgi:hypothetical protein
MPRLRKTTMIVIRGLALAAVEATIARYPITGTVYGQSPESGAIYLDAINLRIVKRTLHLMGHLATATVERMTVNVEHPVHEFRRRRQWPGGPDAHIPGLDYINRHDGKVVVIRTANLADVRAAVAVLDEKNGGCA